MERLIAHDRRIMNGRQRPHGIRGLHGFLYLLDHLFHDCVSHGGHEVLERVHRDIGFPFKWAPSNRARV